MAWSLMLVYSENFEVSSREKTFAKSEYLMAIEVEALFATNAAICGL